MASVKLRAITEGLGLEITSQYQKYFNTTRFSGLEKSKGIYNPNRGYQLPRNMMHKWAELMLLWGFADTRSSLLWLPPVIPGKVDRITTHLAVSVDLFLVEMTRTLSTISC